MHSCALVQPLHRIGHPKVDLRPVERTIAGIQNPFRAERLVQAVGQNLHRARTHTRPHYVRRGMSLSRKHSLLLLIDGISGREFRCELLEMERTYKNYMFCFVIIIKKVLNSRRSKRIESCAGPRCLANHKAAVQNMYELGRRGGADPFGYSIPHEKRTSTTMHNTRACGLVRMSYE